MYTLHRASYFSSTPTDKMYSVVGAAKALYDRLGDIGESSIDGDAFLDLWIYVITKANIKDLVSLLFVYLKKFVCMYAQNSPFNLKPLWGFNLPVVRTYTV